MNSDDGRSTRREVLVQLGAAVAGLSVNSTFGPISPAQARDQGLPWKHFSAEEGKALEALGDALLPGAQQAGIAHYIDHQLGQEAPLLFLQYMDLPGPYVDFYKQGLSCLQQMSQTRFGSSFEGCTPERKSAMIRDMLKGSVSGWNEPPAFLFYFVIRNDAVDVCYGTAAGFKKLGVPYMALLEPPRKW
ncbi:MAG TPA: gluconate 2-dehydrogenase subunit 3 family protein [Acidobacteriaceae bacterium]|jgi:hypothetical protein|nr:gluconate 2-dehydrogenase subunit 3 family protein [Acidobacteriaceae bacterium]